MFDFLKISDKFKEHTHLILRELSNLLDVISPVECRNSLCISNDKKITVELTENISIDNEIDHSKLFASVKDDQTSIASTRKEKSESDILKEEIIMGDLKDENNLSFENFEKEVLKSGKNSLI